MIQTLEFPRSGLTPQYQDPSVMHREEPMRQADEERRHKAELKLSFGTPTLRKTRCKLQPRYKQLLLSDCFYVVMLALSQFHLKYAYSCIQRLCSILTERKH